MYIVITPFFILPYYRQKIVIHLSIYLILSICNAFYIPCVQIVSQYTRNNEELRTPRSRRLPTISNLYEWAVKKHFVSLKLECQSRARTRDFWHSKQAALTTAPGLPDCSPSANLTKRCPVDPPGEWILNVSISIAGQQVIIRQSNIPCIGQSSV